MALTSGLFYFSEFVSNHKEQGHFDKKEFSNSPTKSETSSHFLRNLLLFFFQLSKINAIRDHTSHVNTGP